jgi:16S rRNA (guanine527-N7)-methyltransferase
LRLWGVAEHAAAMGVRLPETAVAQLNLLLHLLAKWNRVYNLTSLRDEGLWVSNHLLDSLSILPILPQGRLIDVGSGGGFPGLPIAIAQSQREVVLLDSSSKKTSFLRQAVAELKLGNVEVVTSRVEDYRPAAAFDVAVSRAFSELRTFFDLAAHLCADSGTMLAMKGVYPEQELARLPDAVGVRTQRLEVPMLAAERHAVLLCPSLPEKA